MVNFQPTLLNIHVDVIGHVGLSSNVIYPNGISCTLPEEMQHKLIRTIVGLENATMLYPGETKTPRPPIPIYHISLTHFYA